MDTDAKQFFEKNIKSYKARLSILNTFGQSHQRQRINLTINYRKDITPLIMKMTADAHRLQVLARRDRGENYFLHIEIPGSDEIEDEVNSWINTIANSLIARW